MATPRINLGSLDFDSIKESLKETLRSQDQFSDYDFEGSGLNILLDTLAFSTYYQGFYDHMAVNESFLDTAVDRESVVSLAKHLGYTPRSITAATAVVDINFGTTKPFAGDYLPAPTPFSGVGERRSYTFYTRQPHRINEENDGNYWARNVVIVQGTVDATRYVVNELETNQRFILPGDDIDTSTLVVRVQNSITDTTGFGQSWRRDEDFSQIGSNSRVYFLDEVERGRYQLYFGDGLVGEKPRNGNLVTVQYLRTVGPVANGIGQVDAPNRRSFRYEGPGDAVDTITVTPARGGSARESVRSIKFNAPRSYQAQNRAVTANDYRSIVTRDYPGAESVFVYGGEEADPPQYGKVFISIKPQDGLTLTTLEKKNIAERIVQSRNVLGINAEVVDPTFTYLRITTDVSFDPSKTEKQTGHIEQQVRQRILNYVSNSLNRFDQNLSFSKLSEAIDETDTSIIGSDTSIILEKRVEVLQNATGSYEFNYYNAINHPEDGFKPVVSSNEFTYLYNGNAVSCFLDDDGFGKLRIFTIVNGQKTIVVSNIGSIDYTTGKCSLVDLSPISIVSNDSTLRITAEPAKNSVNTRRNNIITVDPDQIGSIMVNAIERVVVDETDNTTGTPFPFRSN